MSAPSPVIRTVLGDRPPEAVASANYHEHLFQVSPMLAGDELADATRSAEEAGLLAAAGTTLVVEATPAGLGARPAAVAGISARTGLDIVHVTGLHHGGHYAEDHPLRAESADALAARFTRDLVDGFMSESDASQRALHHGSPVRAGLLKAGIRYWSIGAFERRSLEAVSAAHRITGAAVMVHLDHGSATHEVLDLLGGLGVPADRVVLAHIDRNLDPDLHVELAARGAYLGYDGWARHREAPDRAILDCLRRVVDGGGGTRIVIGGDVARASRYLSYGGMPGLAYVEQRIVPRLLRTIGTEATTAIRSTNPATLLAFTPPAPPRG